MARGGKARTPQRPKYAAGHRAALRRIARLACRDRRHGPGSLPRRDDIETEREEARV